MQMLLNAITKELVAHGLVLLTPVLLLLFAHCNSISGPHLQCKILFSLIFFSLNTFILPQKRDFSLKGLICINNTYMAYDLLRCAFCKLN